MDDLERLGYSCLSGWQIVPYLFKNCQNKFKFIVPIGDWVKNPRLQAKTSVSLRYGTLSSIEPYRIRFKVPFGLDHKIPQAGFDR
jgi:hypothetical protein